MFDEHEHFKTAFDAFQIRINQIQSITRLLTKSRLLKVRAYVHINQGLKFQGFVTRKCVTAAP